MRHLPPSVTSDRKHRTTQHTLLTGATRASDVRSIFIVIRTFHPNWWNFGISNYSIVETGIDRGRLLNAFALCK